MADCYQENCPWRKNETSSLWRCECLGCPNRDEGFPYYTTTDQTEVLKDGKNG